jgi:hypothetical protein
MLFLHGPDEQRTLAPERPRDYVPRFDVNRTPAGKSRRRAQTPGDKIMANIVLTADRLVPGQTTHGLVRRGLGAVASLFAGFAHEVSAERCEHRMRHALRTLDTRLLQDIGIDRTGC